MDISTALLLLSLVTAYLLWFTFISRSLRGPRVWPLLDSLPGLIENCERLHDWISDNLRAYGDTYQTCICAVPFLAKKQGLVTPLPIPLPSFAAIPLLHPATPLLRRQLLEGRSRSLRSGLEMQPCSQIFRSILNLGISGCSRRIVTS
ncbi:unnamed protein product [Linum trigynum]|uniref:Cytochrome P450 n=1 Tax=Linum trigynum TaxID=586398 RepID=A0AAV2FA92_9ROSI